MKLNLKIAGVKPTVLRSRAAWFTWKSNFGALAYDSAEWKAAPTSFPCLAYATLNSHEEEIPNYLYPADIEKMGKALEKAEGASR